MPNSFLIPLLLLSINAILGFIGFYLKSVINRIEKSELVVNDLKVEAATSKTRIDNHEFRIVKIENKVL